MLRKEKEVKEKLLARKSFSKERKERSECENLLLELVEDDGEYDYMYLRLTPERFEHLFNTVASFITKQETNYRIYIPARKRLVITLCYLVERCSKQRLGLHSGPFVLLLLF